MIVQINQNTKLNEIDETVLKNLLDKNADEDVYYDFKEGVDSSDEKIKHSIRKTISSFANTFGGFIFFGVMDKANTQKKQNLDRIVNIAETNELGKKITQKYLERGLCIPLVNFEGPKIIQVENKNIAVIKVIKTEKSPHAVKFAQDAPLEFWARGSGTARSMDYSDLVFAIERNREERGWLNALYLDAENLILIAQANIANEGKSDTLPDQYNSLIVKDQGNLTRVLSQDIGLMKLLFPLRRKLTLADDSRSYLFSQATLPLSNKTQIIENGNKGASDRAKKLKSDAKDLMNYLFENYSSIRELVFLSQTKNSAIPVDKAVNTDIAPQK